MEIARGFRIYTHSISFLQLPGFPSLMYSDNAQFRHILLRTNEAFLDLILGASGCVDSLYQHLLSSSQAWVISLLTTASFVIAVAFEHPPRAPGLCCGRRRVSGFAETLFCVPRSHCSPTPGTSRS